MSNVAPIASGAQSKAVVAYEAPRFLIPQSYEEVERLADKLCRADWIPKSYRDKAGKPQQAMVEVGIMHGLEVGLRPMAALQSIAVINGAPSLWGDGMLALVEASGLMEDISETIERGKTPDELTAVCTVRRRGRATPATARFTVEMAKRAALWGKSGPWSQYPSRMLQLRARSFALRAAFADVLKGLQMAEEVLDMQQADPAPSAPPRPTRDQYAGAAQADAGAIVDAEFAEEEEEFDPALFAEGLVKEVRAAKTSAEIDAITDANAEEIARLDSDVSEAMFGHIEAHRESLAAAAGPSAQEAAMLDLIDQFHAKIKAAQTVEELNAIGADKYFLKAANEDDQLEPMMARRRAELAK